MENKRIPLPPWTYVVGYADTSAVSRFVRRNPALKGRVIQAKRADASSLAKSPFLSDEELLEFVTHRQLWAHIRSTHKQRGEWIWVANVTSKIADRAIEAWSDVAAQAEYRGADIIFLSQNSPSQSSYTQRQRSRILSRFSSNSPRNETTIHVLPGPTADGVALPVIFYAITPRGANILLQRFWSGNRARITYSLTHGVPIVAGESMAVVRPFDALASCERDNEEESAIASFRQDPEEHKRADCTIT